MEPSEVAAVADLPFIVDFDQHRSGEAEQSGRVGEDPDDVGAAFDLLVDPFQWSGRPDFLLVRDREVGEGGDAGGRCP
jgi:hypothetical protein